MIGIPKSTLVALALPIVLFSFTPLALASEVSGSLSSDGSTDTEQEAIGGEINNEMSSRAMAQSNNQLQGSVVQGREDGVTETTSDSLSWGPTTWLIALSVLAIVVFAFFVRRLDTN